jgi:hypothetical protein
MKESFSNSSSKKITKIERVLQAFANGKSLHRFEAFHLRDTCLHSTVSTLQQKYGMAFTKRRIIVTRQNDDVSVMEYLLCPSSYDAAIRVLEHMRQRRVKT